MEDQMKKVIALGAEAKVSLDGKKVVKDRVKKSYRIKEIDERLRRSRTKREMKVFEHLKDSGFVPKLIKSDKTKLEIELIKGKRLRDVLEKKDYKKICLEIGKKVRVMHDKGIIHGDLTTSNMIFDKKVYFIDFGLSIFSEKVEDKAVDLHLLRQALESKHYSIWEECFKAVKRGYGDKNVLRRLEKVESRGRNKSK